MLGHGPSMGDMKKITVEVPVKTLEQALWYSGAGLAETVRRALADYTQREAQ